MFVIVSEIYPQVCLPNTGSLLKKHIKQMKKIQNQTLHFIYNIKGLTSFSQLQ